MTSTWSDLFERASAYGVSRDRIAAEFERVRTDE